MTKKNILVVDDDKVILNSLCDFLTLEGFQTFGVGELKDAFAELRNQRYSLVITDTNPPDGNGFSLLKKVKKD